MRIDESKTFNPGLARHRLRIMRPHKTKDSFNSDVVALVPYATVWGQILDGKGREFEAIQQRFAEAKYVIRMQFVRGVEREMTILRELATGTQSYDILDVRDPAGVSNYTEIIAKDSSAR